jgi:hypothetical protein
METSIIEKLEKTRYDLLKWLTIGWAIWFGTIILKDFIKSPILIGVVSGAWLLGWVIFSINLVKFLKLKRELNWDPKAKEALNDELHQLNTHKSFFIGYMVTIGVTAVFYGISNFINLPSMLVTGIIIYFSVLAALISGLIYNRD